LTIPPSHTFPVNQGENQVVYANVTEMYETIAEGVNGVTKSSFFPQPNDYSPTLKGSTAAGTFTYTTRQAIVHRKGPLIDLWFDLSWSSQTGATGNLYLELPYLTRKFTGHPLIGAVMGGSINVSPAPSFFIAPQSNSLLGNFYLGSNTAAAYSQLSVQNSGSLNGHLRYMGVPNV
jgi:hypothetical protein